MAKNADGEEVLYVVVRVITFGDGQRMTMMLKTYKLKEDADGVVDKLSMEMKATAQAHIQGTPVTVMHFLSELGLTNIRHAVAEIPVGSVLETAGVRLVV
jgi:hypothetical protein